MVSSDVANRLGPGFTTWPPSAIRPPLVGEACTTSIRTTSRASRGIGRAVARGLAHDGMRVAVCARRLDRLEELAEELAPAEVLVRRVDMREEAQILFVHVVEAHAREIVEAKLLPGRELRADGVFKKDRAAADAVDDQSFLRLMARFVLLKRKVDG